MQKKVKFTIEAICDNCKFLVFAGSTFTYTCSITGDEVNKYSHYCDSWTLDQDILWDDVYSYLVRTDDDITALEPVIDFSLFDFDGIFVSKKPKKLK